MKLEEELKCKGLAGFGTGYVLGKANTPTPHKIEGKDSYCASSCSIASLCWQHHMTRVRLIMGPATTKFDDLVARHGQRKAMELWRSTAKYINDKYPFMAQKLPETDPYLTQLNANMQNGYSLAKNDSPA